MPTIEKLNNYIDPFSGWKNSIFGTLHAQGKPTVEFFHQTKLLVERWLDEWSRKF